MIQPSFENLDDPHRNLRLCLQRVVPLPEGDRESFLVQWRNQFPRRISLEADICTLCLRNEHDFHLELQDAMRLPQAFISEMMGDIMYLHQALHQPDAKEFVKTVVKEVNGHVDNKNWMLVK